MRNVNQDEDPHNNASKYVMKSHNLKNNLILMKGKVSVRHSELYMKKSKLARKEGLYCYSADMLAKLNAQEETKNQHFPSHEHLQKCNQSLMNLENFRSLMKSFDPTYDYLDEKLKNIKIKKEYETSFKKINEYRISSAYKKEKANFSKDQEEYKKDISKFPRKLLIFIYL